MGRAGAASLVSEKRYAPATERNREPIAEVLARELPAQGLVLEVASGTGEHAVFFASRFPALEWQPSDPDSEALASVAAYRAEYSGHNLRAPVLLDAAAPSSWPVQEAAAILCINMVHISPWEATEGLFAGAAQILGGKNLPLILYGPYLEQGVETAPSNLDFDASLKARNSRWGLRQAEEVDALAAIHSFARTARYAMPANNLMLVYRDA
ncbi:MAG: SAM-dependent methyltransferase [Erythrobacter sp. SCN 62-14]|nr:MAG: SAM-dependent methyltransferase [Erythrobacter sp. SCN 62-14]